MIAQITQIQPDGSFESQYGMLYAYVYTFSDGQVGTSNHKTPESPFHVGQEVEREPNGTVAGGSKQGMSKFKISKPLPEGQAPYQKAPQGVSHAPQASNARFEGVTIGMAVNNAVSMICHGKTKPRDGESLEGLIYRIGSDILRGTEMLESGQLHGEPAKQPQGVASTTAPRRPSNAAFAAVEQQVQYSDRPADAPMTVDPPKVQQEKPQPGPDGLAYDPELTTEEAPF